MMIDARSGDDFEALFKYLQHRLLEAPIVNRGEWQAQDISEHPHLLTREITNVSLEMDIPSNAGQLALLTGAHMPWAEDHFQERVSGEPLNPAPSEAWWPFTQNGNAVHKSEGEAFSHTYPERMWPKYAGEAYAEMKDSNSVAWDPHRGIRFDYGDLEDVMRLLQDKLWTRQAYLPIWFPEDTGAVHGKRVPCTLGYHFLMTPHGMQMTYYIRSCDLIRHFQDDVYMAGRLLQFVTGYLWEHSPEVKRIGGKLVMHIASLHCFDGDKWMMEYRDRKDKAWNA